MRRPVALAALIPLVLTAGAVPDVAPRAEATIERADVRQFPLRATTRARGARGQVRVHLAPSPFGIPVTADGHLVYDLEIEVQGLRRPPARPEGATYVAWVATPELDRTLKLGPIEPAGVFPFRLSSMNKFILMITLETSVDVTERAGLVMLRGISPSGLMQSFAAHELFNLMPHE